MLLENAQFLAMWLCFMFLLHLEVYKHIYSFIILIPTSWHFVILTDVYVGGDKKFIMDNKYSKSTLLCIPKMYMIVETSKK